MTEQTVGWALHALEPDEELEAVEHLAVCDECRRLAADVTGATTELATALPQHEPPPWLRESIVEQARRTPQEGRGGAQRPVARERGGAPGRPVGRHSLQPAERPRSRWARRPGVLVAAAAVVAVVVGGGVAVGQVQDMRAERDASIARAQQMEDLLTTLARPGTSHAFLADPDDPAAGPMAAVVVHDGQRQVVPMGLAPNSVENQTYVLWGLDGDASPKAVGTFDVRPGADGPVSVPSPGSGTFAMYAVSLERGRQAPAAPSGVVAAGQVET